MTVAGKLGGNVDLDEFAGETKNYPGAEMEDLLNSAACYTFTRNLKIKEVRLTFGVSEEDHNIDDTIKKGEIFIEGVGQASGDRALTSLLLHGPAGSGKTALAALIALQSNLPFVRLISLEGHVGMSETSKITAIENCFLSPLSVIVIDSIGILEWVQIGPRFSTSLLQAVETRSRKTPPKAADC
ncbi:uncharacterized protein YALI1_D32663g [Yarrowia lipolytica]|uniref:Vesicular-fusion protein SEC18 n=1 Tax=Yarrowia lipolytica TaxID=4952 RepID=A0A1D8NG36_YARLL|nr:hypothetical protein YALI1_D32663g [Yarrowia lipolytica]